MCQTAKYFPALVLLSVLGGCSMAGSGDYFADDYADLQRSQMPHYYGSQVTPSPETCQPVSTSLRVQGPCQPQMHHWAGGQYPAPQSYPPYGYNVYGQPSYAQAPYGQTAYVPPLYGPQPYGLRGSVDRFRPHAYGTLGAVTYEMGEELYGAQARLGYQFNKYLGAEAEGSLGISTDKRDGDFGGVPIQQDLKVKNSVAGFGIVRFPLIGKLNGYGRLGYHQSELDRRLSDASGTFSDTEFSVDGIAYGSGLEYTVNPRTSVRLDYTSYDFDGPDADAISLAISRKF